MSKRLEVTKTYKLYINGGFPRSESGRSLPVQNSRGTVLAQISHGSRKDLRDAVEAASAAQPKWGGWGGATAYNRGQILYRMAEMMEGQRDGFVEALKSVRDRGNSARVQGIKGSRDRGKKSSTSLNPQQELDASIDRLVCFAGWADKYAQVLGCNNPVAGPYYNFTVPEPTGVVGVVAPDSPALLSLISLIAPPLCTGNAIVAISSDVNPLPAAILGEVCETSDVPPGVINIITGKRAELLDHLARHRNVNAISSANLARDEASVIRSGVAENVKRVRISTVDDNEWFDAAVCESPWTIEPFVEMKTIWHPSAV